MIMYKARVYLTFKESLIQKPVIYEIGHRFKVVTNVRSASVSGGVGVMALEIDGEQVEVLKALDYLRSVGVEVKPIEQDVVE